MSYLVKTPNEINKKRGRRFTNIWDNMIKKENSLKNIIQLPAFLAITIESMKNHKSYANI